MYVFTFIVLFKFDFFFEGFEAPNRFFLGGGGNSNFIHSVIG